MAYETKGPRDYGKPTFQQYDDPAEQWIEWKRQAARLPLDEIKRHASVSTSNRHSCRDCFCCACVEVVAEALPLETIKRIAQLG